MDIHPNIRLFHDSTDSHDVWLPAGWSRRGYLCDCAASHPASDDAKHPQIHSALRFLARTLPPWSWTLLEQSWPLLVVSNPIR